MSSQNGTKLDLTTTVSNQQNGNESQNALQPQLQAYDSFVYTPRQRKPAQTENKKNEGKANEGYGWKKRMERIVQRMAYLPVPPETRYLMSSSRNPFYEGCLLLLGIILLIIVVVWFVILFFVIFAGCESVKTISTRNLTGDGAECTVVTLPVYGSIIMDYRGKWVTEAGFQFNSSIWKFDLFEYKSTRENFVDSTRSVMIEAEEISKTILANKDWVTRMQALSFTDRLRRYGIDNGALAMHLDLDVTAISHGFSGFSDKFFNFSKFIDQESGTVSTDSDIVQDMVVAAEGCGFNAWSRTNPALEDKTGRFERLGGIRNWGVFIPDDFASAVVYNDGDCNQPIKADGREPNTAQSVFKIQSSVPIATPGVASDEFTHDFPGIPAILSVGEFRWDMRQVLYLDLCNKYPQLCLNNFTGDDLYPIVQHEQSQQWGYEWTTQEQSFTVVPQFYTPDGCQCESILDVNKACDQLMGMFLHIYNSGGAYLTTYSLQLVVTGSINTRLVPTPPHCSPYSPSKNTQIEDLPITVPDNLETGFYDCTVKNCMDVLERLATAQLNDELLFILIFVLILLISVYVWAKVHRDAKKPSVINVQFESHIEHPNTCLGKLQSFFEQLFVSVLPEESGYICPVRIVQVVFGALAFFCTVAAFIFFIFYLNQCEVNNIVSETDQSDSSDASCVEMLLSTSGSFRLDQSGRWDTQSGFDPTTAFWILEFEFFEADEDDLRVALQQVRSEIDNLVDTLIGKNHIEATMRLLFNDIRVPGARSGSIRVQPNMDLIPINTFGQDLFFDLEGVLGIDQAQKRLEIVQNQCGSWKNTRGNAIFVNQSPLGFYSLIYPDGMNGGLLSQALENGTCPFVRLDSDQLFSPYPAFFKAMYSIEDKEEYLFDFAIDARQAYALSFCNQFPSDCSLAMDLSSRTVDRTSNRLMIKQHASNGQWGYLWTTGQNPWSQNITFLVVPEILPSYECFDNCNKPDVQKIECDQSMVHLSHFYLYGNQAASIINEEFESGDYVGTFSTLKVTTGKWNREFSTDGPLQCQMDSNLKFSEEAANISNPFNPSKNLYDCEVRNCPSILERFAQAFGDTEFLFMAFILVLLVVLLFIIGCCATQVQLEEFVEVEDSDKITIYLPEPPVAEVVKKPQGLDTQFSEVVQEKHLERAKQINQNNFIQEIGHVVPAFQRAFELPVPEKGHRVITQKYKRWFLGLVLFLILLAAFIGMIIIYVNDCHTYRSLTLNPPSDPAAADCQPTVLAHSGKFYMDNSGKFHVEKDFDASSAYWTIILDNYKGNNQRFRSDLQNLTNSLDVFLEELSLNVDEKSFLNIMQEIFFFQAEVEGMTGTMRLQANFDLSTFMKSTMNYYTFSMHNPRQLTENLDSADRTQENIDRTELNGIYDCSAVMYRQGFGRIYGQGRELTLATPFNGLEQYISWNPNQCFNGTEAAAELNLTQFQDPLYTPGFLDNYFEMYYGLNPRLGAPVNQTEDIHQQQMEIKIPLEDILMVDFCRRQPQRCLELVDLEFVKYQTPLLEILPNPPPDFGTGPNVSFYRISPKVARSIETEVLLAAGGDFDVDKAIALGIVYSGGWNPSAIGRIRSWNLFAEANRELQMLNESQSIYSVIPSVTPHTECFTCAASRQIGFEECQRGVEMRLEFVHFYPVPISRENPTFYQFGLLYVGFRTDGYFNEFLSKGDLCDPTSLGFTDADLENVTVPYAAESGLWNCEIKQCKGYFEIIGDAFGNVQELFVLCSLILYVIFVYIEVFCLSQGQ